MEILGNKQDTTEQRTNTSSLQDITTGCVKSREPPPLTCVKLQRKMAIGDGDMTFVSTKRSKNFR